MQQQCQFRWGRIPATMQAIMGLSLHDCGMQSAAGGQAASWSSDPYPSIATPAYTQFRPQHMGRHVAAKPRPGRATQACPHLCPAFRRAAGQLPAGLCPAASKARVRCNSSSRHAASYKQQCRGPCRR